MATVDSLANQILDDLLGSTTYLPATVYIGLLLSVPNSDGTGVSEPVGGAYARPAVANDAAQWPAAAARIKTHANDIIFATATLNWGTILWAGVFDAAVGGNLRLAGALNVSRIVNATDQFRFLAVSNSLRLTMPF